MNFKAEVIVHRINNISNAKYIGDPDLADKRKNYAFFVSVPAFMELKHAASEYTGIDCQVALMREIELEVLGFSVFASDGIDGDVIYFAEKYKGLKEV